MGTLNFSTNAKSSTDTKRDKNLQFMFQTLQQLVGRVLHFGCKGQRAVTMHSKALMKFNFVLLTIIWLTPLRKCSEELCILHISTPLDFTREIEEEKLEFKDAICTLFKTLLS